MFANRTGLMSLMKDGGRHFSGLEEATFRNIEACKKFSGITKTSMGPNSMNKLISNHIEKLFVTSDAATIIDQMEIQHPAAKVVALASKMQEQEFGDFTNFVVTFAGELLVGSEYLLKQGLHSADITKGYEMALEKLLQILPSLVCYKVNDIRNASELENAITAVLSSKGLGFESVLAKLIVEAAIAVMPSNPIHMNLDNIRVGKIVGGNIHQSFVVQGMVVPRDASGVVKEKTNCKVLVLGSGLEISSTETKGTVLINSAQQLMDFSKGEEDEMEAIIKEIADSGVEAIIVGGAISDLAQHFCNKFNILTLKCQSKFELRRICRALGAVTLVRLGSPSAEEVGYCESIKVEEIASKHLCIIKARDSKVATIVLRAATTNILEEIERSIDDGVHCIKNIAKDPSFLAGGGACDIELSQQLRAYGASVAGLEQYAVVRFSEALEVIPRVIAENSGLNSNDVIPLLHASHKVGNKTVGVDVDGVTTNGVVDMLSPDAFIVDHYRAKECAIRLAVDAALTVLRVDQIIMARPAGGPAPPKQNGHWDED